jgi:hypothetical protein
MHSQSGRIESEREGIKHPAPSASANGGGVFVTSGTIDIISCEVYSNTARAAGDNADGGGIFVPGGASRSLGERDYKKRASPANSWDVVSNLYNQAVNPFFPVVPLHFRALMDRNTPTSPGEASAGGAHKHKGSIHSRLRVTQACSTTLVGLVGSLSLPAQMYRGWPAAAVAWPFPLRSPA